MAKDNNNNSNNDILAFLQKHQKAISHNGGGVGQGGQVIGLWQDKQGNNRHISLGDKIVKHQAYMLDVKDGKIVLYKLSDKTKGVCEKQHIKYYQTSGIKSYICITKGDNELWQALQQVFDGVYKVKTSSKQGQELLAKVEVIDK